MKTICEKIIAIWSKIDKVFLVKAMITALLGCIVFSNSVADYVFSHMVKYHDVVIYNAEKREDSVSLNTVKIIDNNYEDPTNIIMQNLIGEKKYAFYGFEQLKACIVNQSGVSTVNADVSAYGYGYFEFTEEDSYIKFRLPVYPNTCLTISTEDNAHVVVVEDTATGYSRAISYENVTAANSIKVYPYGLSDYLYIIVSYVLVYLALFAFLLVLILLIFVASKKVQNKVGFLQNYNPIIVSIIMFGAYVIFTTYTYYNNREILQIGQETDAYFYMNPQVWDESGNFSIQVLLEYLFSFRGYFSIVVAVVAKTFQAIVGVNEIYCYFIYYGLVVAFTMGFAMPRLYEYFTEKKANNLMCLSMFVLFCVFWSQFFYFALADIPAAMFAISGLAFMLFGMKKHSIINSLLGGVFWGIALSYRMAYSYIFMASIAWLVVVCLIEIFMKKANWKRTIILFASFFLGVVLISIPQFCINYSRGHIGLFPYSEGGWSYDVNSGAYTAVSWTSFTTGFHRYGLYGTSNADKQLAQIDQYYYMEKVYSAGDLLFMVFTNPIEFFVGYFKRLFWAMSAGVETVYGYISIPGWFNTVAKLLNYSIIGQFVLTFARNGKNLLFKVKDMILILVLTVSSIFIQNLSHIERRYYLFYYLIMYFVIAFIMGDSEKKEKKDIGQFILMVCFVLGCFILRQTIGYNF